MKPLTFGLAYTKNDMRKKSETIKVQTLNVIFTSAN